MKTTLEKKSYTKICDGFLCWNESAKRFSLQPYDGIEEYEKHESVGLTCHIFPNFSIEETAYFSSDKSWGYIDNILFSVLGMYLTPVGSIFWYHIRIEAIE